MRIRSSSRDERSRISLRSIRAPCSPLRPYLPRCAPDERVPFRECRDLVGRLVVDGVEVHLIDQTIDHCLSAVARLLRNERCVTRKAILRLAAAAAGTAAGGAAA